MNFSKEIRGDVLVEIINLKRATVMETEEFRNILFKDIDEGWKKIVIDLKECSFMDSTFLGTLLIGLKTIIKREGDLRIAGAHGDSQAILELTQTSRVFKSYKNLDDAIASFN